MTRRINTTSRFSNFVYVALILWVGLETMSSSALGQANTATVYGTVNDSTGAVVPHANVTLTREDTGQTTTMVTEESGDFGFTFVPVGVYTLRIDAPGFKTQISKGIALTAGQQMRQTFTLEVGSVTETVNVEATTPLVNTVSAQQLQSYNITDARELPLQNRNVTGLLKINAGVVPNFGEEGSGVNLNGIGRNGTMYTVDGTNASGNSGSNNPGTYQGGNLIDLISVEGVEAVSVVKGVIPAEYANALGGQVNVVSRSGSNAWHGSLFENHQSSALNARFQRVAQKPRLTFNQFGGSLGGPILRNRIFVFGDYEGYRQSQSSFVQGNVPTAEIREQLLRAVPDYELALKAFPLPNQPVSPGATVGAFATTKRALRTDNHYDAKGDVVLTANSRLSLSYSYGSPYRTIPNSNIDNARIYVNSMHRGNVSYILTGTDWTSETRFGYNRTIQDRIDEFFNLIDPKQPNEEIAFGRRLPRLSTTLGWSGPGGEINHSGGPLIQVEEKFARYIGRHAVKFGGNFQRSVGTRNNPEIPSFFYASLSDMLINRPSEVVATLGSGLYTGSAWSFGLFAQDDWRITQNLTLNLGLRYDFYSNFLARGQGGTPQAGLYNPSYLSMDGRFDVGPYRSPFKPYENDPLNLAPRVGFAWNPDGANKTAIRGGFGVMFSNIVPEDFWNLVSSAPNVPYRVNFTSADINAFGIKYPMYNDDFMRFVQQLIKTTPITNVTGIYNPNLQSPYTMQYTLDIQREITPTMVFQTAFVGTRGVKFVMFRFANQVDRLTGLRPNPNLRQPYYVDNSQTSTYYGWQNSFRKRFSRGLSFDANYTWSKALANGGGDTGAYYDGENFVRNQSFFNLRADRGPAASDITHYFSGSWLYQMPSLANQAGIIRHTIGGWQATGMVRAQTGLPVILTQSSSTPGQRAEYIGGKATLSNYRETLQYVNPAAFQRIPVSSASGAPIRPGNTGPGFVRAPGMWNVDFSLAKNFSLQEKVRLQIRTDMFNVLNHTNLSGLRTSINDIFFGQLLSTTGARIVQLNARLTF
ncbi:MAG TPA: TonB-dependent receptor [Bryobacteraceae bacterium]|nr:TonB-dependent receptor [Bryobacteraceae bacterium]